MIPEFNPDIFIVALNSRRMTGQDLAAKLNIDKGIVSRWRHGIAKPTREQIADLAVALSYPEELFYRPERVRGSDSVCIYHRKRKAMPAKLLESLEANMHMAQLHAKWLLSELNIDTDYRVLTLDPEENDGPYGVAEKVRAYWRIPTGPIMDLTMVVEAAGALVVTRPFETRLLDGMSCWAKNMPPLFFMNSELPADRMRWCIAHELGHLIMHATPPLGDQEQQAEDFARGFLMPKPEVFGELRQLTFQRLPTLKKIWRVPMKELITAASRWEALPPSRVKSLAVQYSRAGYHTAEPWPLPPEAPSLMSEAVQIHREDHGYRQEELARIVGLSPDEFGRFYGGQPQQLRLV